MSVRVLTGDCRDVLRTLPDASVNCVITSPPYFGLRSYFEDGLRFDPSMDEATKVWLIRELEQRGIHAAG